MPSILVLLFIIALTITLLGLFLSPRYPARSSQSGYLVTPRGRRIVEAAPVPVRAGRPGEGEVRRRVAATLASQQIAVRPVPRAEGITAWKWLVAGLATMFVLALYLLNLAFPHAPVFWTFSSFGQPASDAPSNPTYTASQHLIRLGQLDPAQYQSQQEYTTWGNSTCSAASMAEVINAYGGQQYRVTDILKVESGLGEITPDLGLLEDVGIQRTAVKFGFKTSWGHKLKLDQVIAAANNGTPVIVSFPPPKWPGGHILVVRGGDKTYVYLADSSRLNLTQLSRERFTQLWAGFSAILTPA